MQTIIQSVSSMSPAAATHSWLDAVSLYTLAQLHCLMPRSSSPAVSAQVMLYLLYHLQVAYRLQV